MSAAIALAEAVQRWALHCAEEPEALQAQIHQLRRATGAGELDAHSALLADVLQGVHTLITENRA